jgi:enoyl-CoA hydratase
MTDTQDKRALIVEREGAVVTLINNDAPRNRMSMAYMDELEEQVAALAEDRSVRAVVFSAAGEENFSVGMNLKELPAGIEKMGGPEALFDQRLRVLAAIEQMPKPTIALLYGYCLGGGLELPLAEGLAAERRAVMATFGTRDMAEGMAAFMEKRKPHFTGE